MAYPTMIGLFSFSASSKGVCAATRGSGVQSSTSSSISYSGHQHISRVEFGGRDPNLFRECHFSFVFCRVCGCEQVSDCEKEEEELDRGADGVILVAGLYVAQEDGGARDFLKLDGYLVQDVRQPVLCIV